MTLYGKDLLELLDFPAEVRTKVKEFEANFDFNKEEVQQEIRSLAVESEWEAARDALKKRIGEDADGIGILTCMLHSMVYTQEIYEKLGIPEQIFVDTMKIFSRFTREHLVSYGRYGFDREFWVGRQLSSVLFRVGALEYELTADVLPQKNEDIAADVLLKKDENIAADVLLQKNEDIAADVLLKKDEDVAADVFPQKNEDIAAEMCSQKEPLIHIHIPSDTELTIENCQESFRLADAFFRKFFPERANDRYACDSWLLSPGLKNLLGENSRIIGFQNQFEILHWARDNKAFMEWLFQNRDLSPDEPEKLPEKTSLHRKAKEYLKNGGKIGEAYGLLREECRTARITE